MKAADLMIGDWVMYGYFHYETGEPIERVFQITQIEAELGDYYVWSEDGRMCHPELLNGIPLTPEILEKNGFKKGDFTGIENQHTWTLVIDTIHYVYLWTRNLYDNADEGWVLKAETSQVNGGLSLNAVHELQHTLRLCGIEKEITLN